ncbi:MAG: replication and repair protein RecF [Petroclostridium sp.]|jgi:DNA replication and repair protein RecF|uniref:DNA replication/repair protein RecF n=1 Tax=Petroclostridium xylanilyticum TaxID=1792311 RepID=UPI000B989816|nr:DNA replication/repair protein RecF [Petroclostridium xylanilyticum]MBZ4646137.1 recF [Clostridia bacterium]MDK2811018.1 replication and repair protein RecF [Petroclostridium sp.]
MHVSNIKLSNYRNYNYADIDFGKGINVIYGNNAQGKTNILESIYLFATGKSHRTNRDKELIRFGYDYANIKMSFLSKDECKTGEMVLSQNQKKRIKINEIPINRIGELMGFFNAVMFSPEDLNLIKEGPSLRRRFLDVCISQMRPAYFYNLQQYMKVLEQRNNLLKTISKKSSLQDTLSVWDEKLMEYGAKIILYRALFIKKIQEIAKSIHFNITQGAEQLDVQYLPNVEIGETNQLAEIKKLFEKILNANKRKEVDTGITLTGPHRDDVDFIVNNISVKNFGSQGQQRTAVLSLKMAEMEFMKEDLGEYPVLLLDDIMSELDHQRQEYILRSMENKQVMITCTDIDRFIMDRDISFFKIEKGTVLKGGH